MAGRKVFNEQDARRCLAAVKASRVDLGTSNRLRRFRVAHCLRKIDQLAFRRELLEALVHLLAQDSVEPAERASANGEQPRALSNGKSRPILIGPGAVSYTHLTLPTNREV